MLAKKTAAPALEPIALSDGPVPFLPAGQTAGEGVGTPDEAATDPPGSSADASRRNSDVSMGSFMSAQDADMDVQGPGAPGLEVSGHGGALRG